MHIVLEALEFPLRWQSKIELSAYSPKRHVAQRPRDTGRGPRGEPGWGAPFQGPVPPTHRPQRHDLARAALPRPRPEPRLSSHRRGSSAPSAAPLRRGQMNSNRTNWGRARAHSMAARRGPSATHCAGARRCPGASAPHCADARRSRRVRNVWPAEPTSQNRAGRHFFAGPPWFQLGHSGARGARGLTHPHEIPPPRMAPTCPQHPLDLTRF